MSIYIHAGAREHGQRGRGGQGAGKPTRAAKPAPDEKQQDSKDGE